MTRYAVAVGERRYHVEVGPDVSAGAGQAPRMLVDGEPVAFELTSLNGNGLHLLRGNMRTMEMYFKAASGDDYDVLVNGRHLVARVDSAHRRARKSAEEQAGDLKAPMPGLIVDVPVAVGQMVSKGDVLVVQESMKMQMQLRAACTGTVQAIQVSAGDQVGKGSLLVRVAEAAS